MIVISTHQTHIHPCPKRIFKQTAAFQLGARVVQVYIAALDNVFSKDLWFHVPILPAVKHNTELGWQYIFDPSSNVHHKVLRKKHKSVATNTACFS